MRERTNCVCMHPPLHFEDFDVQPLACSGEEPPHGGEVSVETCRHCGTKWLKYFVEYPAFTASGRWCRGAVTNEELAYLSPASSLSFLEGLPWYLYGGSFFKSTGMVGRGRFHAGL